MREEVFRYAENNRGFGMMSLPEALDGAPVVVLFNSGLIHREGPYRLNVMLSRALADCGYIAIRVDLSGKGDTPARENMINRESVALDWKYIKESINTRFGKRNLVLMGLCSGADNAIKITAAEKDVKGLILLDPISARDEGFSRRAMRAKLTNINKWLHLPVKLWKRAIRLIGSGNKTSGQVMNLRDEPTAEDSQLCFRHIASVQGRVLAFFTSHAMDCYNEQGQFVRALHIDGLDKCCEEVFWPLAEHLYPVEVHRQRLVDKVKDWAKQHFKELR
jgi:hypothetical protein